MTGRVSFDKDEFLEFLKDVDEDEGVYIDDEGNVRDALCNGQIVLRGKTTPDVWFKNRALDIMKNKFACWNHDPILDEMTHLRINIDRVLTEYEKEIKWLKMLRRKLLRIGEISTDFIALKYTEQHDESRDMMVRVAEIAHSAYNVIHKMNERRGEKDEIKGGAVFGGQGGWFD
jgi:hypothetical protein